MCRERNEIRRVATDNMKITYELSTVGRSCMIDRHIIYLKGYI